MGLRLNHYGYKDSKKDTNSLVKMGKSGQSGLIVMILQTLFNSKVNLRTNTEQ